MEEIYKKAWQELLKRIEQKTSWGKTELKQLMLECLRGMMIIAQEGEEMDVKHWCPECEKIARIPIFYETGDWYYPKGKDKFCKECGAEMEIVD